MAFARASGLRRRFVGPHVPSTVDRKTWIKVGLILAVLASMQASADTPALSTPPQPPQKALAPPDNTGVAPYPLNAQQRSDATWMPPAGRVAAKKQLWAMVLPSVLKGMASVGSSANASTVACPASAGSDCYPTPSAFKLEQPLTWQTTLWSCGPAATLLVLWQMTGTHKSEDYYGQQEHTVYRKGGGTSVNSIAKTLTAQQREDYFYQERPGSPADYMGYLATATYWLNHGIVNGLHTPYLSFWSRHDSYHINVSYGYRESNGGFVYMAEQWNPEKRGISLNTYGNRNPYGHHYEKLSNVWAAIEDGYSKSIVW